MMGVTVDYFEAMLLVDSAAKGGSNDNGDYSRLYRSDGKPVPPREQLEAAWAGYVPPKEWRADEFWNRFTQAEQVALVTAAKRSDQVGIQCELLRMSLVTSPSVRSDSAKLIAGINSLTLPPLALLTAERAAAILNPRL